MNTDPSGEFVRRAVRAVGNVVNSATTAVVNTAARVVAPVVQAVAAVVNTVVTAVVEVVDTVVQVVTLVVDGVRQVVQGPRHDGGIAPMNAAVAPASGGFWSGVWSVISWPFRQVGNVVNWFLGLFRTPTSPYTLAQEREENWWQRGEVVRIIGSATFNQDAWNTGATAAARLANRQQLLNQLLRELQVEMGTRIRPAIQWFNNSESTTWGYYSVDGGARLGNSTRRMTANSVYLNTSRITDQNRLTMLRLVAHEARHAYQWESYRNPGRHIVSNQTNSEWYHSIRNQVAQGTFANGFPSEAHMRTPIEFDAYHFSGHISRTRFRELFRPPHYYLNWYSNWTTGAR